MIDTAIGLIEGVVKAHDIYKGITNLVFGDKKEEYLQQIAADMKDMKVHIERLSDTILYAVNLDGVRACKQKEQQYVKDLREIRELLEPMQRALNKPLLTSALISAPMRALSHPSLRLKDISLLRIPVIPVVNYPWVPMLFEEDGEYWIGWQTPEYFSQELGCESQQKWQPNQNVMSFRNPVDIATLFIPPTELKKEKKVERDDSGEGKVFRDRLKDGGDGPEMVWIPAGRFQMGDIQGTGRDNEQPVHEVSVERFAMGRYPVTVGEFRRFVEATKYQTEAEKGDGAYVWKDNDLKKVKDASWRNPYFPQEDNQPVVCVSWNDAIAFIEWLNQQTGKEYRLPTEAEWEYAARAGTETDYWWGNDIGKNRANCNGSGSQWSGKQTSPVGSFEPNPFGLYDTAGNVWEWIASEYENKYRGKELRCIEKSPSESIRLSLRGGSWGCDVARMRSAFRFDRSPTTRDDDVGLRVARLL
jgi:formylglycine-generating enzyme required for sulfatase activity